MDASLDACRARINGVSAEEIARVAKGLVLDTVYFLNGTLEGEEDYEDD